MSLLVALSPVLILVVGALLLMLVEAFWAPAQRLLPFGTALVCGVAGIVAAGLWMHGTDALRETAGLMPWFILDRLTLFLTMLLCLATGLASLLASGYLPEHNLSRGEIYPLMLFSTVGGTVLVASGDVLTLFLGLETLSLGAYSLTAFRRNAPRSVEAGMKYFLLGSFAAALLLYGFALLYAATGHTDFAGIQSAIRGHAGGSPLLPPALLLLLVGLLFKISAVPFHMWTPDAYEGAPTPSTMYMSTVVKSSVIGVTLRLLGSVLNDRRLTSWAAGWPPMLATVALLTLLVANVIAIQQTSVKRMLAYSSISHAGYLLIGLVATVSPGGAQAGASVLFYLVAYTVSSAGALGALMLCGSRGREAVTYDDLAGLGTRHPTLGLPFALCLLSLAGIPPTAGFLSKWFLIRATFAGGFPLLGTLALLATVLAAYPYLRVLVCLYMRTPQEKALEAHPMRSRSMACAVLISTLLVLWLGMFPQCVLQRALGTHL